MLPRLEAEESLQAAVRVGIGSGKVSADEARSIQSGWQRTAQVRRPRAVRATTEMLPSLGIEVVYAPKPKEPT